ncbi:MAG: RimK-like ATPgrasp N-terminal domain-containing protein [Candidatus Zixiibacteriota bacterium]|nr:MAG: RimK-like ATPgrasp N-terminal domain-containing protein [candidate division Zixibacteria bacterium]
MRSKEAKKDLGKNDPKRSLASLSGSDALVNLAGNYDYLSDGYYLSLDCENAGKAIRPTCKEMLDAYVPPLFLGKARQAGAPVPECYISNGYFEPPVIVDPINPFTLKGRVVLKPGKVKSIARSLTRNFTYAVCCQEIPVGGKIEYFRSVLGWALQPRFRELSRTIWEVFGIPLAKVRVIRTGSNEFLLSDVAPLFIEDLGSREKDYLEERVSWVS